MNRNQNTILFWTLITVAYFLTCCQQHKLNSGQTKLEEKKQENIIQAYPTSKSISIDKRSLGVGIDVTNSESNLSEFTESLKKIQSTLNLEITKDQLIKIKITSSGLTPDLETLFKPKEQNIFVQSMTQDLLLQTSVNCKTNTCDQVRVAHRLILDPAQIKNIQTFPISINFFEYECKNGPCLLQRVCQYKQITTEMFEEKSNPFKVLKLDPQSDGLVCYDL